jgi:fatty acid desaturase
MQHHTYMNKWEEEREENIAQLEQPEKKEDISTFLFYMFWLSAYINYGKQNLHCVQRKKKGSTIIYIK